jgi:branched-chain amino acid transport system substrate-binding protein
MVFGGSADRTHGVRVGRRAIVPLLAAATLLLAACGDDDSSDGGSDSTTNSGADLPGSPIVLGVMANVSGPTGVTEGKAAEVLQAWADSTNENGGINGHPVELRVEDTRGDAPTASSIAEEFVADPSVVGIVHMSSATEAAVGETFADSDLAVVGGAGYNPTVWHALPNWYGITTSFPAVVNEQVAAGVATGAENLGVVACSDDPSCLAAVPIFEAATDAAGVNYTGTIQASSSAPNYTAECLQLNDEGVEFAQLSGTTQLVTRVAEDCLQQGYEGWFGASAGTVVPELYNDVDGIRLTGGTHGFPWWIDSEPVQQFRDVMEEQGVDEDTYSHPTATAAYASGELFAKALSGIAEGDTVTRQTVQDAYGAIAGETLDGLLPQPTTFTAGQPAPPVACYWLYTFEDGEFSGGEEPTCES